MAPTEALDALGQELRQGAAAQHGGVQVPVPRGAPLQVRGRWPAGGRQVRLRHFGRLGRFGGGMVDWGGIGGWGEVGGGGGGGGVGLCEPEVRRGCVVVCIEGYLDGRRQVSKWLARINSDLGDL